MRSNRQAQRTIGWAVHLVIVSPLWHTTMPALDLQAAKPSSSYSCGFPRPQSLGGFTVSAYIPTYGELEDSTMRKVVTIAKALSDENRVRTVAMLDGLGQA